MHARGRQDDRVVLRVNDMIKVRQQIFLLFAVAIASGLRFEGWSYAASIFAAVFFIVLATFIIALIHRPKPPKKE